jgi:hypothetical protein
MNDNFSDVENLDINNNQTEYIFTLPIYNNNIFSTIENMLDELRNNTSLLDINNENDNTLHLSIEFDYIPEDIPNYFKSCKEINEKISHPLKVKKNDIILNESCLICIENYKFNELKRILPKCKHCFHKKCIDKWLKKSATCPVCRDLLL